MELTKSYIELTEGDYEDIDVQEVDNKTKNILNACLRFVKDKNELDSKVFWQYYLITDEKGICPECGQDCDDDWDYCPYCGEPISNDSYHEDYFSNRIFPERIITSIEEYKERLQGKYPRKDFDCDEIDIMTRLCMDKELYYKTVSYLEGKKD